MKARSHIPLVHALVATIIGLQSCSLDTAITTGVEGSRAALNSDMIAARFGSYGVRILSQDERRRISELYSGTPPDDVARTIAVVHFAPDAAGCTANEHARILAGESIGATFRAEGWQIRKRTIAIDAEPADRAPDWLHQMMRIAPDLTLAMHEYELEVRRGRCRQMYATVLEIHHPAHRTLDELLSDYGPTRGTSGHGRRILGTLPDRLEP